MINSAQATSLLHLPDELLHQSLSYLDVDSTVRVSGVCRRLHQVAHDESLWQAKIQPHLPYPLTTHKPAASYRELYQVHQPYWFIPERKIWFSDAWPYGKLLIARYDARRGCIEAYTLTAEQSSQRQSTIRWLDGTDVTCLSFAPRIALDLNRPVVSLTLSSPVEINSRNAVYPRHQKEIVMNDAATIAASNVPCSSFMLTQKLPGALQDSRTRFWPPLILPSPAGQRTRNDSRSSFSQPGSKPSSAAEASDATFRVRQWVQFGNFYGAGAFGMNPVQQVRTFATLDANCFTPTAEKPWQGIWCGDFSAHGCEFLLITQPDSPIRLPRNARKAYAAWPRSTVIFEQGRMFSNLDESSDDDDNDDSDTFTGSESSPTSSRPGSSNGHLSSTRAQEFNNLNSEPRHLPTGLGAGPRVGSTEASPYTGRLEAIKLTGDPNVPRGEYTFIAPDIGDAGLVGHIEHPLLTDDRDHDAVVPRLSKRGKGARVVKSIAHIAENGYRREFYIPSQLVMISEHRLAQYWPEWGHLAFFERVNVENLVKEA